MKKKLIILSLLLAISPVIYAQYQVLKVIGGIRLADHSTLVKQGMKIAPEDVLIFGSATDKISLIIPGKGRYNVLGIKAKRDTKGRLAAMVKEALVTPEGQAANFRGQITNAEQLTAFFTANQEKDDPGKFLIIEKGEYTLRLKEYPMSEQQFFFISYQYQGETINKKLAFDTTTFYIDAHIFQVDGAAISQEEVSEIKLMYVDLKDGNKVLIANFDPVFAEKESIVTEVKQVIEGFPKASPEELFKKHVFSYLAEFYGQPDPAQIKQLLQKEVGLSLD